MPNEHEYGLRAIDDLVQACRALRGEPSAVSAPPRSVDLEGIAASTRAGGRPLAEAYALLTTREHRRQRGQVFTPTQIIEPMVAWAQEVGTPQRVVDPGTGDGRFLWAVAEAFTEGELIGCDIDPVLIEVARANASILGQAGRVRLQLQDYRTLELPEVPGPTLFIGNLPFLGGHKIGAAWKQWMRTQAAAVGVRPDGLADLYIHFVLQTMELARPGDIGAFLVSGTWLANRAGQMLRDLMTDHIGGVSIHFIEDPNAFPDANTSVSLITFMVDSEHSRIRMQRVNDCLDLGSLTGGTEVTRTSLRASTKWTDLIEGPKCAPSTRADYVPLGILVRVQRGASKAEVDRLDSVPADSETNAVPVAAKAKQMPPDGMLTSSSGLPQLKVSAAGNAKLGVAAPILVGVLARNSAKVIRNIAGVRHLNTFLGLHPTAPLTDAQLDAIFNYLKDNLSVNAGTPKASGLSEFRVRDLTAFAVPSP